MIHQRKTSSILSLLRFSSVLGLLPSSIAMIGTCSGICSVTKSGETFSKSTSILSNGLILKRAHFEVIDSSQTRCKEICSDTSKELLKEFFDMDQYSSDTLYLLTADTQTSSYGRSNRTWHSVQGNFQGTYMFYWPDKLLRLLPYSSQTVGLAVAQTVEAYGVDAEIKWTNDVLINGKKTAGILIDALPVEKGSMLVIGIGLNVNMDLRGAREKFQSTTDEMKIEFTSMRISSDDDQIYDLEEITNHLSLLLGEKLLSLLSGRFSDELHPEIERRLAYKGKNVIYTDDNEYMDNIILKGITSEGFAILKDQRGNEHVKLTGRIRPSHDYY